MTITTTYKLVPVDGLNDNVLSDDSYYFGMAGNSAGSVLLAGSTGDFTETDGLIYDAAGEAIAGPFPIGAGGTVNYDPAVAALSSGSFVTAYSHLDAGSTTYTVDIQLTAANGVAQGSSFSVSSSSQNQYDTGVAGLKNGNFVVTWTREFSNNDLDTEYEIFTANGTRVAGTAVDSSSSIGTYGASVAALKNGGFVVAFQQYTIGSSNTSAEFRLYDADGNAMGAKVDADTAGTTNDEVQAVALADGGFALAYRDNGWSGSDTDITMKIYNADGSSRSNFIEVNLSQNNNDTDNDQSYPSITQLQNGLIVVSWDSFNGTSYDIDARVYDAKGHALTDVTNLGQANNTNSNALAAQLVGTFMAGWTDYNSATGKYEARGGQVNVVRSLVGDNSSEVISGNNGIDFVAGNGGNDKIYLYGGDDKANGGLGDDLIRGGNGNDRIIGLNGNDKLYGDAGDDFLSGGVGHDTLTGGAGHDTFVFNQAVSAANLQTITDFTVGDDAILLGSNIYGHTLGTSVDAKEFKLGTHATTAFQHIIYDGSSGALYFDADGSGSKAQVELAQLGKNLQLSYHDFEVGNFKL